MINANEKQINLLRERNELNWLWYLALFLLSTNFMAKSNILLLGLLVVGMMVSIYKKSSFKVNIEFILIWLFSISYYLILNQYIFGGIGALFTYMIGPVAMYFVGYIIVKGDVKFIYRTISIIIVGNFIHGTLNMFKYFQIYGINTSVFGPRIIPDIWTGIYFTATILGTKYTLVLGLLFYSIFLITNKANKKIGFLIFLSIIFSLFVAVILGNRTAIVILLINFFASVLLYNLIFTKLSIKKIKTMSFIIISFFIIFVAYSTNTFGIKDFVESTTWFLRSNSMELTKDPRLEAYKKVFGQLTMYPLGGYRMYIGQVNYVHNLWLDVLYATGLIPFFLLVLYTLKSIKNLFGVLRGNYISIDFKLFIFNIYLAYILNFMIEPILEGVPYMFLSFCLINGMIRKLVDVYKQTNCLKKGDVDNENTMVN